MIIKGNDRMKWKCQECGNEHNEDFACPECDSSSAYYIGDTNARKQCLKHKLAFDNKCMICEMEKEIASTDNKRKGE